MNFVSPERELEHSLQLIEKIVSSGWVDGSTVLVNCSPEYSSRLTQLVNHKLSHLNKNFLFEQVEFLLPTKERSQFWDSDLKLHVQWDKYLLNWMRENIFSDTKYLFITNSILTGREINKLRLLLQKEINSERYRFASLYYNSSSSLVPDFSIKHFDTSLPIFFWENKN